MRILNHRQHPPTPRLRRAGRLAALTLACFAILRCASAATWYVDAAKGNDENAGDEWNTSLASIQKAVDKSSSGDAIIVTNGVYAPIVAQNKIITIKSINGATCTFIDGGGTQTCATLGDEVIVYGFTFQNGYGKSGANGSIGPAAVAGVKNGKLYNCIFRNGRASGYGASSGAASADLYNCLLYANEMFNSGTDSLWGGAAVHCRMVNCTVAGNINNGTWDCCITNSIVWGNSRYDIYISYGNAVATPYYCCYPSIHINASGYNYDGEGCVKESPLFVDMENHDYRLAVGSPCINAGDSSRVAGNLDLSGNMRVFGGVVDIGCYEYGSSKPSAQPEISLVSAKQRYPWNGKVDVDFKLEGTEGAQYNISLSAKDVVGNTNLPMRTVYKCDGSAVNVSGELVSPGTYRWVWDAAADLPDGFQCEHVSVTIESSDEFLYYVKFNANGGTGTMENESFTYGAAKLLTSNSFTRAGYLFQGWAMSSTGEKVYDDRQSVSNLTETSGVVVNLYAVWTDVHDKVQLWEGGPYWATTNIGANEPWESGYYFWWGDTIGYKREGNAWVASDGSSLNFGFRTENTPTYGKSNATLKTEGWLTEEEFLAPEHDAAQMHWGGGWRLPRRQELDYLVSLCDWTWTTTNNVKGYVVRGRGEYISASIFLPITGYGELSSLSYGSNGYYWSSDPTIVSSYYNMPYYALYLYLSPPGSSYYSLNGDFHTSISGDRNHGCPLRPVKGISE